MPSTVEEASSLSCMCLEHAIYMKLSSHTVRQLYLSWGNVCETRMETKNEQNTLSTEEIPLFTFPKNFAQKMYGTRPGQLSFGESNCHWTNFCRSHVSNINSNCLIVDCCENQMSGSANYFFFFQYIIAGALSVLKIKHSYGILMMTCTIYIIIIIPLSLPTLSLSLSFRSKHTKLNINFAINAGCWYYLFITWQTSHQTNKMSSSCHKAP